MKRWGVWLVSFYFIVWGLLTIVRIISSPSDAGGFFGIRGGGTSFKLPFFSYNNQIDFDAWWKVFALFLIGYFLLRFHPNARLAALIILWPSAIWNGLFFLITLIYLMPFFKSSSDMSIIFHTFSTAWQIKGLEVPLFAGVVSILTSLPVYILMRKDVKMEFQSRHVTQLETKTE